MARRLRFALLLLLLHTCGAAYAFNPINPLPTQGTSFFSKLLTYLSEEYADEWAEQFQGFVASGCLGTVDASLTHTPSACTAYPAGHRSTETAAITYQDSATCYAIIDANTSGSLATNVTFSRVSGTHYLVNCTAASQPVLPAGATWLMRVTTSGGAITAVADLRNLSPVRSADLSIEQVGALGDGATDATTAIQTAVESTSGCAYIPAGNFAVASEVNVTRGRCLRGVGERSKLIATALDKTVIRVDGSAVILRDFFITKAPAITGVTGIWINPDHDVQANYGHFENLRIEGLSSSDPMTTALVVQGGNVAACGGEDTCESGACGGTATCGAWYSNFFTTRIRYVTTGVLLSGIGGNGANANRFFGLRVGDSATGFRVTEAEGPHCFGCSFEGITGTAVVIEDAAPGAGDNNDAQFFGMRMEANGVDINIGPNSFFNRFEYEVPITAKIIDNGTGTQFYGSTLTKTSFLTYADTDATLHINPFNGVEVDSAIQFDGNVRDPGVMPPNKWTIGGPVPSSGQCGGGQCFFSVRAPNTDSGATATFFGDSQGRVLAVRSPDFDTSTSTGSGCGFAVTGTANALECTINGTADSAPLRIPQVSIGATATRRVDGAPATDAPATCDATTNATHYFDISLQEECVCNFSHTSGPRWCQADGGGCNSSTTCG